MSHLTAWGDNERGQLGAGFAGKISSSPVPTVVVGENVVEASASGLFTLARLSDGTAVGWGGDVYGQLMQGTRDVELAKPVALPVSGVKQVASSGAHVIVLSDDGMVCTAGSNTNGQLGNGTSGEGAVKEGSSVPVKLLLAGIVQVAAGSANCAALDALGSVWTWGEGRHGACGDGTTVDKTIPVRLPGFRAVEVAAGGIASVVGRMLARLSDGTVLQWGQILPGKAGLLLVPKPVPGLNDVVKVVAGAGQSFAIKSNGDLYAWGANTRGQLGVGAIDAVIPPTLVLKDVSDVSAGFQYSACISGGNIFTWGRGDLGQLGNASLEDQPTPTQLESLGDVSSIDAGERHTIATLRGPVAPSKVHIEAGPGSLTVKWDAPETGGRWHAGVRPATKPASPWGPLQTLPGNARSFTASGLTAGQPYQVKVSGILGAVGGPWTLTGVPL